MINEGHTLPDQFTFPFYYTPHILAEKACEKLQKEIESRNWEHNFGLDESSKLPPVGKMFGVLVVQLENGSLGYISAFSGKIGEEVNIEGFVPPVFDRLTENSHFLKEEILLNQFNDQIDTLAKSSEFEQAKLSLEKAKTTSAEEIATLKKEYRDGKKTRKTKKEEGLVSLSEIEIEILQDELRRESLSQQHNIKRISFEWKEKIAAAQELHDSFANRLTELKQKRKAKSQALQKWLFDQYSFLNAKGELKSLWTIFKEELDIVPPSGAGECAAPKLLHYAFQHGLKPVAMAEFWWGKAPNSIIRKHKHFYPACKGKCEPILGHMLKGLDVEENPLLTNPSEGKELEIIQEDEDIIVVNKPHEFLTVPGKTLTDCVFERIKHKYPEATGPIIVHRLDMSTSGIVLLTKTKEANKFLQQQFIKRTIKKRYVALLDGIIETNGGEIELPLRVDLDNRPNQMVCYEHGKPAKTRWERVGIENGKTRVYFYPITGRTHQLRVHASHPSGLNTPIIGDDLYGKKSDRLHLHAESLEFIHPRTREVVKIKVDPKF